MIRIIADGKNIDVPEGTNLLQALNSHGLKVPSLCNHPGVKHRSYCYVCAVEKIDGSIVASCAVNAEAEMEVRTDTIGLADLRRSSLDLILANHRGDCYAPCERVCPFGADIPNLLRAVSGKNRQKDISPDDILPFGELTCRLCHAPCEKACRRAKVDRPVAIRSQMVVAKDRPCDFIAAQKIADTLEADLVTGFASAWVRFKTEGTATVLKYDGKISENTYVGWNAEVPWNEIHEKIFLQAQRAGIELREQSSVPPISFVVERSIAASLVKVATAGKLSMKPVSPSVMPAVLSDADWVALKEEANDSNEASRCLHCDCRSKTDCLLKAHSIEAGSKSLRQPFVKKNVVKAFLPGEIIVDSGKCILCGSCCDISQVPGCIGGFYLEGKGEFYALAWNEWDERDSQILQQCALACPTGALTHR